MTTAAIVAIIKLVLDFLKSVAAKAQKSTKVRRASRLVNEAIGELLKTNPDLHVAKAKLEAATAAMPSRSPELLRAIEIFDDVEDDVKRRRKKVTKRRPATTRKKAIRTVAKKKAARKKKATRKKAGRAKKRRKR